MDITPFNVLYTVCGAESIAEIRPCCREDNVVDYAVWIDKKLGFTITRDTNQPEHWVIAMKNADTDINDDMVQSIGEAINKNYHEQSS